MKKTSYNILLGMVGGVTIVAILAVLFFDEILQIGGNQKTLTKTRKQCKTATRDNAPFFHQKEGMIIVQQSTSKGMRDLTHIKFSVPEHPIPIIEARYSKTPIRRNKVLPRKQYR